MPVIVPYVAEKLRPETKAWAEANHAQLIEIDVGDEIGYWRLLAEQWLAPGDLIIVEHDMLPAAGVTVEMEDCRRPWCSSPYPIGAGVATHILTRGLGVVKFAARLKDRHPDLLARVGEAGVDGVPLKHCWRLDTRLTDRLDLLGYRPHTHRRSQHLHDYRNP